MKKLIASFLTVALTISFAPVNLIAAAKNGQAAQARAQNRGEIGGTAEVESKPIPNVTVRLRNVGTDQLVGNTTSDATGVFKFTGLPNGTYVVETVAPNGTLLGTSDKITLSDDNAAATVVVRTSAAAAAAALALLGGGTAAVAAGAAVAGGAFLASTAGIITVVAIGAGVTAAVVATTNDSSPSGGYTRRKSIPEWPIRMRVGHFLFQPTTPTMRSYLPISLALLTVISACSAPPDPRRTNFEVKTKDLSAKYNPKSGKLERIDIDQNKDGRIETFSYWDGALLIRIEVDKDEDGKIDRWEHYDEKRTMTRVGGSSKDDQIEDTWTYPDAEGAVSRVETDTDRDGDIDRRELFAAKPGAPQERFLNIVELDLDKDGRPAQRLHYRADGSFERTENVR
jgi:hypothetical protein